MRQPEVRHQLTLHYWSQDTNGSFREYSYTNLIIATPVYGGHWTPCMKETSNVWDSRPRTNLLSFVASLFTDGGYHFFLGMMQTL